MYLFIEYPISGELLPWLVTREVTSEKSWQYFDILRLVKTLKISWSAGCQFGELFFYLFSEMFCSKL